MGADLELPHPFAAADAVRNGNRDVVLHGDSRLQATAPVGAAEPVFIIDSRAEQVGLGIGTEPGLFRLRFRLRRVHRLRFGFLQFVFRHQNEIPGVARLGLAAAPDIHLMLGQAHDMVQAHTRIEAEEGVAAQRQRHVVLVEREGQVVGRHVGHVEVTHDRVGRTGDAQVVHAVLVGVDVTLVLPDQFGPTLDEGILVVIERASFLSVRIALPPGRAVDFRRSVDVAHAKVAVGVAGKDPGLAFGGVGAAGQGVEARRVEQAVVVVGDGDHFRNRGAATLCIEGHCNRVIALERIGNAHFVTLGGGAVPEVPQGDSRCRGGVLQNNDVRRGCGGRSREGELALADGGSELVVILVQRCAGEKESTRDGKNQADFENIFHFG